MYPLVEPRQRPERFTLNRFSPLAQSAVFLGLGGFDAAGSVWYPDAMRLLGAVPNDGTLTNMDPATNWVCSPELGRWALDFDGSNDYVGWASTIAYGAQNAEASLSLWMRFANVTTSPQCVLGETINRFDYHLMWYSAPTGLAIRTQYGSDAAYANWNWTPTINTWHHIAITRTAGASPTFELWVDGVSRGTDQTATASHGAAPLSFHTIGLLGTFGSTQAWKNGRIADVLPCQRVLSSGEISALADPSNVMLSVGGVPLVLPLRRQAFPAAVAAGGFKPYWLRPSSQIIGGGIA